MLKNLCRLFLLLSVSIAFSCKSQSPVKEFEGVITYKTHYTSVKDSNGTKRYTDTLTIYYSHGNIAKVHSGSNVSNIKKEMFLGKKYQYYCTLFNVDTVFWNGITASPHMELAKMEVTDFDKTILGHRCKRVDVLIKQHGKYQDYYSEQEYVFAPDYLPIDKNLLSNYTLGYFDQVMAKSEHFYLGYKYKVYAGGTQNVMRSIEYEAISVKEQKVDANVFLPDKLPLKEFKL